MSISDDYNAFQSIDPDATPIEFVAGEVFGLTTYDSDMDAELTGDIVEVFSVIRDKRIYDYIANGNLSKFTRTINMGNCLEWLDWGTSIRGAWIKDQQRFDDVVAFLKESNQSIPTEHRQW